MNYGEYPVGETEILPTHMSNTYELEKIEKELRKILSDPSLTFISIQLKDYSTTRSSAG